MTKDRKERDPAKRKIVFGEAVVCYVCKGKAVKSGQICGACGGRGVRFLDSAD